VDCDEPELLEALVVGLLVELFAGLVGELTLAAAPEAEVGPPHAERIRENTTNPLNNHKRTLPILFISIISTELSPFIDWIKTNRVKQMTLRI